MSVTKIKSINLHLMIKKSHFPAIIIISIILIISQMTLAQEKKKEIYKTLYQSSNYKKALSVINKQLNTIYSTRVKDKRVPTGFITMKEKPDDKKLLKLFRKRKTASFFIEENIRLSTLHLYAGRCYFKLNRYDYALRNYIEALRYKKLEYGKDDVLYYEIAQVFKKTKRLNAYYNALEEAVTLNPEKYTYSLELGKALSTTRSKKQAIFHLERYIKNSEEDISPPILLMLGNLYEDIHKYLKTEHSYIEYLKKKPDDAFIQFALGYLAFKRTGNYQLAGRSLTKALSLLPEGKIVMRAMANEYLADMAFHNLNFKTAVKLYQNTLLYHEKIKGTVQKIESEIHEIDKKINALKSSLLLVQDFDKYDAYENLKEDKGKMELKLRKIQNEYNKINAGRARFMIAQSLTTLEDYPGAIKYYREAVKYNYRTRISRKMVLKLELKIKRGY